MSNPYNKYEVSRVLIQQEEDEEHCQSFPLSYTEEQIKEEWEFDTPPDASSFAVYENIEDSDGRVLQRWIDDFDTIEQARKYISHLEEADIQEQEWEDRE